MTFFEKSNFECKKRPRKERVMLWRCADAVLRCCTSSASMHQSDDEIRAFLLELKGSKSWLKLLDLFEHEIKLTRSTKSLETLSFCMQLICKEVEYETPNSIDTLIETLTKTLSHTSHVRRRELEHQIDFLAHLSDVVSNHGFPATLAAKCVEDIARRNRAGGHSESSSELYSALTQDLWYDLSALASKVSLDPSGPGESTMLTARSWPAGPS